MPNYNDIFLMKTGQYGMSTAWEEVTIESFLDSAAYLASRDFATPWSSFNSIAEKYKYPVVIFSAIEYWWSKAGEYASKYDVQVGASTSQKSGQMFYRALEMIDYLKKELETVSKDMTIYGSGDIIVGDLVKRSKFTGYEIPRSDDPAGNWLA